MTESRRHSAFSTASPQLRPAAPERAWPKPCERQAEARRRPGGDGMEACRAACRARHALDALTARLDGRRAAVTTVTRKRAVFHGAASCAVELGLLPVNPLDTIRWQASAAAITSDRRAVASPAQVHAILAEVSGSRPELAAFSGACTWRRCGPRKPSPCARTAATWPPADGARWSSTPPRQEPPPPGPAPEPATSTAASSRGPRA
jgi:hypothetical protein